MSKHLSTIRNAWISAMTTEDPDNYYDAITEEQAVYAWDAAIAAHDREVKAAVRESLAADLYDMAAAPHLNAEYRAGLGHAADLVRPVRRIESEARP